MKSMDQTALGSSGTASSSDFSRFSRLRGVRHGHSDQWRSHGSMHLVRHSLNFCSWKDRKAVAADLRPIYEAPTAEEAARQLEVFEEKWAGKYPSVVSRMWWKLPSSGLRACNDGSSQAARSRDIGSRGWDRVSQPSTFRIWI